MVVWYSTRSTREASRHLLLVGRWSAAAIDGALAAMHKFPADATVASVTLGVVQGLTPFLQCPPPPVPLLAARDLLRSAGFVSFGSGSHCDLKALLDPKQQ